MRFSVDAHAIGRHQTGNEVYIRSLLNAFAAIDKQAEFITYLSSGDARPWVPSRFETRTIAANPFVRLGLDLSTKLRQDHPDLVHVQYTAPLACPVPVVVSVHDVSFLEHPEFFTRMRALQLRWSVHRTVRSAARILTGSEFSRDSILAAYGLEDGQVVVVPNAASPVFRPEHIDNAQDAVRTRFAVPCPYLLTVGDQQPRKNHIGLIRAFAKLIKAHPQLRHRLVIAGKETWFSARVREAVKQSGVADRIRLLGFVSDDDLMHLYNACEVFVFPSFYEGFGLPLLEAMACGRAVACSNTSAMPEVADGAAILFDPYSSDEIARALADLLLDSELRIRMERLGQQRATQFNWQRTASQTLEVYYSVAEQMRGTQANGALGPKSAISSR
ncbi:MAG: glycosyltransferase family 4 protein [Candidatus Solibacter usitatus]|nr:glycosyltransferase family 4 protein [Candidatus Solibacter usitatus]